MKQKQILWTGALASGALILASAAWAQGMVKLSINGNVVNTQTRVIGGKTWVPLDDVARALKMQKSVANGQITLRPAGGATQVANKLKGQQGEELFSGKWRFTVTGVTRTKQWNRKYPDSHAGKDAIEAGDGNDLIVVSCRLKNGTPNKTEFAFSSGATADWGMNTSLTDQDEGSYQPKTYDLTSDEGSPVGRYALPGAAIPFNIVFAVPAGTQVKDLVYSVVIYGERGKNKSTDFRVALKESAP